MKVVCAWCYKVLADDASEGAEISHGICTDCRKRIRGEATTGLSDFLNELAFPVLAVDADHIVLAANHAAEQALGKSAARIEGRRQGVAIECYYAGMPEGCGKTAQCRGCALRKNIADTHVDGLPRYGAYAQQQIVAGSGTKMVQFKFSTQKVAGTVLLTIEELKDVAVAG